MQAWRMMVACAAALIPAQAGAAGTAPVLSEPVPIMAGGKPISVDVGHAAPFVADLNNDGKPDLLVGQFGEGKLRIYLNQGSKREPRFEEFTWFQAGGAVGKVPSG